MSTNTPLDKVELLFNTADQMGLQPDWIEEGSIFAITTADGERYVNSAANSNLSSRMAANKHTTRTILRRHGLPSMPYLNPSNLEEAEEFLAKHKKIIVKPLSGTDARDVHIVESPKQLASFQIHNYILERYAPGKEMRYLLLDNKVIGVHESQYGESVAQERDLLRISYPETQWNPQLVRLSLKVAKIFGLRYAAVDYIIGPDGRARILEVNSSPGMKWFQAPTSGPAVDVARLFLEAMLADLRSKTALVAVSLAAAPIEAYS